MQVDIQRTREDTKKCEKENAELSKEFTKTQDRIGELDNEIVKAEEEYQKLYFILWKYDIYSSL